MSSISPLVSETAAPLRAYADFSSILAKFAPWSGDVSHGFTATPAGSLIRKSFHGNFDDTQPGPSQYQTPPFPGINEEFFEWVDLYEAIDAANGSFCMVEIGAGYGRWLVAAACALKRHRPMPIKLVGIEAEGAHFAMLGQHFRDNGLDPADHWLIEAACNGDGRDVFFAVGSPTEWYGQAIVNEAFKMARYPDAHSIKMPAITLQEILGSLSRVDLIDMDVQGAEAEIIEAAIVSMTEKVRRVHIGTHGHDLEERIRTTFRQAGWRCCNDYPCLSKVETDYGEISFGDGVQTWINLSMP